MIPDLFRSMIFGAVMVYLAGCASIISGRYDDVIITTNPANAEIYDQSGADAVKLVGITPAKLTISRKAQPILLLRKDGFQDSTVVIKRRINPLISISIAPAMLFAIPQSFLVEDPASRGLVWMGFTFFNLIFTLLPDYSLGGAWEHKTQDDVSLEKEEIDAAIDDGRAVR
jgi:hypothetical protein